MKNYPQVVRKAKRLVDGDMIIQIDADTYQIPSSSKKDHVHVISDGVCDCGGYKNYKLCSHTEAVKLFVTKMISKKEML